jgi:RNA polymerase sigma-70 factor (ECF subfamily)
VLAALTPEHRAILVMRDLGGWSEHDVADALAIAPGTAKSRLSRARAEFVRRWST